MYRLSVVIENENGCRGMKKSFRHIEYATFHGAWYITTHAKQEDIVSAAITHNNTIICTWDNENKEWK